MNRNNLLVFYLCSLLTASLVRGDDELVKGFQNPPNSTKPWAHWYWISGNISREGLTRDLEAMASVGIGGVWIGSDIFLEDVQCGTVRTLSKEWWGMVEHAIREGNRLGVEIGMFNCPGWSQSGGPWISPEQSMRYLLSSEVRVTGPVEIERKMPTPSDQFQDIATLAFPAPLGDGDALAARKPTITSSPKVEQLELLADSGFESAVKFPRETTRTAKGVFIDIKLSAPMTARSLAIYPGHQAFETDAELEAIDSNGKFIKIRKFKCDRADMRIITGPMPRSPVVISFPVVKSEHFRIHFSNFKDLGTEFELAEIDLSSAGRLEFFPEKQLAKMHSTPHPPWEAYQWPEQNEMNSTELIVPPGKVYDLHGRISADGVLRWKVPQGEWVIQRIGMSPTGVRNAPASPEGEGLEVDKMSRSAIKRHFDGFIGEVLQRIPARDRKAFTHVVAESYETGSQNWTDGFGKKFKQRYGYAANPWLPVLTGRVVGSKDQSDRFLWDLRRLVADHIASEYVGGLRDKCRSEGLALWLENYGHWGFPSEFLKYGSQADRICGEFWLDSELGSVELRAASSCVNTYGLNPLVSAEAFTGGPAFQNSPRAFKARGDWAFSEGINHFILHVFIHQPWEDRVPGINAWFGSEFNRHNTWFYRCDTWIQYLRRCFWLLQQGNRVTDVAYFIGEDAPKMTGVRRPELPPGRDFDYINAEVIEKKLRVESGVLTLPHGAAYRVLVLPEQSTMRPELMRKLRDLVKAGATIIGPPPLRSPSLENYSKSDDEVRKLAREVWGNSDTKQPGEHRFGKGRVIWGRQLDEVMATLGSKPDFESSAELSFTHRRTDNADIYFVANPKAEAVTTTVAFRVSGKAPEVWRPDSGRVERPAVYDEVEGRVRIPLSFGPQGSLFVVFRKQNAPDSERIVSVTRDGVEVLSTIATHSNVGSVDPLLLLTRNLGGQIEAQARKSGKYELKFADGRTQALNVPTVAAPIQINGPWEVGFSPGRGAPEQISFDQLIDWTKRTEDGIKYFSGRATYRKKFELTTLGAPHSAIILDLGEVRDLATVRVNGRELATLWHAPWRVDITSAVTRGQNTLEIEVVNPWNNRLVGDAALPVKERSTFLTAPKVSKDSPLLQAGLLGPVTVRTIEILNVK